MAGVKRVLAGRRLVAAAVFAVAVGASLPGTAALAATVSNAGTAAVEVSTIGDGNARATLSIPGGEVREDVCPNGCILTLVGVDDADYTLEGDERVTIENGKLYYDGPIIAPDEANSENAAEN